MRVNATGSAWTWSWRRFDDRRTLARQYCPVRASVDPPPSGTWVATSRHSSKLPKWKFEPYRTPSGIFVPASNTANVNELRLGRRKALCFIGVLGYSFGVSFCQTGWDCILNSGTIYWFHVHGRWLLNRLISNLLRCFWRKANLRWFMGF